MLGHACDNLTASISWLLCSCVFCGDCLYVFILRYFLKPSSSPSPLLPLPLPLPSKLSIFFGAKFHSSTYSTLFLPTSSLSVSFCPFLPRLCIHKYTNSNCYGITVWSQLLNLSLYHFFLGILFVFEVAFELNISPFPFLLANPPIYPSLLGFKFMVSSFIDCMFKDMKFSPLCLEILRSCLKTPYTDRDFILSPFSTFPT